MYKSKIVILAFVVLIITLLFFLLYPVKTAVSNPRLCVKNTCFNVTIAGTPAERERGLMFVTKMKPDAGMFFIFEQNGIYPFWMKNTLLPLDIIWIDENGEISFIKHSAQPCFEYSCPVISPATEARYVLEVNAGAAERLQLQTGDAVIYPVE